jgi:hypothetical protein
LTKQGTEACIAIAQCFIEEKRNTRKLMLSDSLYLSLNLLHAYKAVSQSGQDSNSDRNMGFGKLKFWTLKLTRKSLKIIPIDLNN